MYAWWKSWFPDPPTFQEQQRQNIRKVKRAMRELERECTRLEREEPALLKKVKGFAQKGNKAAADAIVKKVIRRRNNIAKLYDAQSKLDAIVENLQLMKTTTVMAQAMGKATRVMMRMSKICNLTQMQHMMMKFEQENERMEMKQELMDDTIDDMSEMEGDDKAQQQLMDQIYDEIGVETADTMKVLNNNNNKQVKTHGIDDELSKRINNLKL